ncbi:MAG: hypothetical protein AAF958_07310 [Planctomycetota bacterium]
MIRFQPDLCDEKVRQHVILLRTTNRRLDTWGPLQRWLASRYSRVIVWQPPTADLSPAAQAEGLRCFLSESASDLPVALITHGTGDWLVRKVFATDGPSAVFSSADRPAAGAASAPGHGKGATHWVSLSPRVHPPLPPPSTLRHLAIWPRLNFWNPSRRTRQQIADGDSSSLSRIIWGTHFSVHLQPRVWRMIDEFLRCRTVSESPHFEMPRLSRLETSPAFASSTSTSRWTTSTSRWTTSTSRWTPDASAISGSKSPVLQEA